LFKRILVPLDGSSFGETALRPARELARRAGGELRLLSVHEPDWFPTERALTPGFQKWREDYLAQVGRGIREVPLSIAVRTGKAERLILDEAASWGADVIVMSTHGRGAVSRFWLGSVADHCLRHSRTPLMLVRARPSEIDRGGAPFAPGRLVVPLDGSELAERALPIAVEAAETFGARLSLIRVLHARALRVAIPIDPSEQERTELGQARAEAARYLDALATRLASRGLSVGFDVVESEHPAPAIIEHAAGDLVVMATHAQTAKRAALGSVTDKVVRGTRGSVLAIPEDGAEGVTGERGPPVEAVHPARPADAIAASRRRVV
jgi:nucleotide-binding universal stress UspA family protein